MTEPIHIVDSVANPSVRDTLSTRYRFPSRREPRTITNIDRDILDAQRDFDQELGSIHRWHEIRREQILRELANIDKHYYDMVDSYNHKWTGYISELRKEREPLSFADDAVASVADAELNNPYKHILDGNVLCEPTAEFTAYDILSSVRNYTAEDHIRERRISRIPALPGITRGYADETYDDPHWSLDPNMQQFRNMTDAYEYLPNEIDNDISSSAEGFPRNDIVPVVLDFYNVIEEEYEVPIVEDTEEDHGYDEDAMEICDA